jgi:hypothetical protein
MYRRLAGCSSDKAQARPSLPWQHGKDKQFTFASLYLSRNQGSMIAKVQDADVLTRTIEAANVPKEADPIWTRSEGRFFFSNCRFATAQEVPGVS